jgi:D-beta-D-heptose 7-phosphate kinase / D-beta-D-heptose 1-phosphate adenosyltransferase
MMEQLRQVIREIEHYWALNRLLVLGDVMLDKYILGEVGRIPFEAPVTVVRATHHSEQSGGAANLAANLSRLDAKADVIGFTGYENERLLAARLDAQGIAANFVVSGGFPIVTKQRILWMQADAVR